jgi:hypothetical protein
VGNAAIEESMRLAFLGNKGAKLTINVGSVQVLAPEVVVEKGSTSVTAKDGEKNGALYTAIHVKKDGKWKINQLIETPLPQLTPQERLQEVAWLVGTWEDVDKSTTLTVRSDFTWGTRRKLHRAQCQREERGRAGAGRMAGHRLGSGGGTHPFVDVRQRRRICRGPLDARGGTLVDSGGRRES